jgi:hypothetical protein
LFDSKSSPTRTGRVDPAPGVADHRGDPTDFITRPIGATLPSASATALFTVLLPALKARRAVLFKD